MVFRPFLGQPSPLGKMRGGGVKTTFAKKAAFLDHGYILLFKDIVSWALTLGWKNKKQPSGPTELDLEAGNLVQVQNYYLLQLCSFGQKFSVITAGLIYRKLCKTLFDQICKTLSNINHFQSR